MICYIIITLTYIYEKLYISMKNYFKILGLNFITFLSSFIPVFKSCPPCPICMPKYAALFAFFGLELADYSYYLMPVMIIGMILSLLSIYYKCHKKNLKFEPFYLALSSCLCIVICKFVIDIHIGVYIGMFGLLIAIVQHHFSLRKKRSCC